MTTKKFIIAERKSNGEFARMSKFDTREKATKCLAEIFTHNEDADPQNFKILVEYFEVNKTELLVEELIAKLRSYGDEWIVTQEENRATIRRTRTLWSSAILMDIVEFMNQPEYADHNFYIDGEGSFVIYNKSEANY